MLNFKQDRQNHINQQSPYIQDRAYQRQTNPELLMNKNLENIAKSLLNFKPISDVLNLEEMVDLKLEIKKYKESVYRGQIKQGKRDGKGIMIYANGRIYEGNWLNNYRHNKGYEKFSNGSVYKGNYVNGKPQGYGRYEWENDEVYEGQWKGGVKHGSGIWRGSKGDSYIGQWQQGKAEGYGVHTWTNGDRYEGQFKECLKHGEGVQRFANGDTYKGNYQCGKPSGYGEYYWVTGSFFKGSFKDGLRNGQGVWKKGPGRSDKYEGEWVNDKKQGYGVFTGAQGNIYKGNYLNDLRHGYGEQYYANGKVYKGNWRLDRQIEERVNSSNHDEDCQLFIPSARFCPQYQDFQNNFNRLCNENQDLPQPIPLYNEPQRPQIMKSASRHIRPKLMSKNSSRSEQKSRIQSYRSKSKIGMTKKMSVGTVASKQNPYIQNNQKALSASFFLYKIQGQSKNPQIKRRQIRTSQQTRVRQPNMDEQLKYFERSKIGSFSQLH